MCREAAGDCDAAETCDGATPGCPDDVVAVEGVVCRDAAGPCDLAETCDGALGVCPDDVLAAADTVCREAGGACDPAETCDGALPGCPDDALAPAGEICREAAGLCDLAEACDGVLAACPDDLLTGAGEVCREAAGDCDAAETCDGATPGCPDDVVALEGVVCRDAAGPCDLAETCDGALGACPDDVLAAADTVCREAGGACDPAETCDGALPGCPDDALAPAGEICREAAGLCDLAEACDGVLAACPDDLLTGAGVVCRETTGPCDLPEACDGALPGCPDDVLVEAGTVCRAGAACDPAETCDGALPGCPDDKLVPAGEVCRAAEGPCDVPEACSGLLPTCPHDLLAGAGGVCREAIGPCDAAEACDGATPACPDDVVTSEGVVCRDAAGPCDLAETCDGQAPACPDDAVSGTGTLCRDAVGPCDLPEACDGADVACPDDALTDAGTPCRASAGPCDQAETCVGDSPACPEDLLASAGTVCRGAAGPCDIIESCDGDGADCPADVGMPAGTVCRAAAGDCDVPESCDGATAACPDDDLAAAGAVCRAAIGDCDLAEACSGSSASCPADAFAGAGVVCRASAGGCDDAEVCAGDTPDCPANAFLPAGALCRAAEGPCDAPEVCSGEVAACPTDALLTAGAICRAATGLCDPAEACSGTSATCPADLLAPLGTECRATAGLCDLAETCIGASAACPADTLAAAGAECRPASGLCDTVETCSGAEPACPDDALLPGGTVCRPAQGGCDLAEACTGSSASCPDEQGGTCKPNGAPCSTSAPSECAVGSCAAGQCGIPNGGACTTGLECLAGACLAGTCGLPNGEPCDYGEQCVAGTCDFGTATCGGELFAQCSQDAECASETCHEGECLQPNGTLCFDDFECAGGFCGWPLCGKPDGEDCTTDGECAVQKCDGGVCGKPNDSAWNGEPCTEDLQCVFDICWDGACGLPTGEYCEWGFECRANVCTLNTCGNGLGEACTSNADCGSGTCDDATCLLPAGEFCAADADCAVGACTDGWCALPNGAACVAHAQCAVQSCFDAACGLENGEWCSEDTECASGNCADGKCGLPAGAPCESPGDCAEGLCGQDGLCKRKNGYSCAAAAECESGFCAAGTCCSSACEGGCAYCSGGSCKLRVTGTACRAAAGDCDAAEVCGPPPALGACEPYEASDTSYAQQNFVTCAIALTAGDQVEIGACNLPGGQTTAGVPALRLYLGTNYVNYGSTCSGSNVPIVMTVYQTGVYELRQGCQSDSSCAATVAYRITSPNQSAACPPDAWHTEGTVCRASTDACDVAELCPGDSVECPPAAWSPAGAPCREAAGPCDAPEACTGEGKLCPPDQYLPPGATCRPAVAPCDVPEVCTGMVDSCPEDAFVEAGVPCRATAGDCDLPEACSGDAAECPFDALLGPESVCRTSAGACDPQELCPGDAATCPPDALHDSATICRPAAAPCDVAERCDSGAAACPTDAQAAAGTVCRLPEGGCDLEEACDGAQLDCPDDLLTPTGTVCRPSMGPDDVPEACTGTSGWCPADELTSADPLIEYDGESWWDQAPPDAAAVAAADTVLTDAAPDLDDPLASEAWFLTRIGAIEAWAHATGAGVVIAIVDSGCEADHPELQRDGESVCTGGVDVLRADADADDELGHGTALAGVIAGQPDNGEGAAGVAPGATIVPIKVIGAERVADPATVAAGIDAAVAADPHIILIGVATNRPTPDVEAAIASAVAAGILVVAASGSFSADVLAVPASSDGVLAVGASDSRDLDTPLGNLASDLALLAPGEGVIAPSIDADYGWMNGASPAAGQVAAAAALVLSAAPGLSASQVSALLVATAAPLPDTAALSRFADVGRLDAATAVLRAIGGADAAVDRVILQPRSPVVGEPAELHVRTSGRGVAPASASLTLTLSGGTFAGGATVHTTDIVAALGETLLTTVSVTADGGPLAITAEVAVAADVDPGNDIATLTADAVTAVAPDLEILDARVVPPPPHDPGGAAAIAVRIANVGSAIAAGRSVDAFVEDALAHSAPLETLAPGAEATVTLPLAMPAVDGGERIRLSVRLPPTYGEPDAVGNTVDLELRLDGDAVVYDPQWAATGSFGDVHTDAPWRIDPSRSTIPVVVTFFDFARVYELRVQQWTGTAWQTVYLDTWSQGLYANPKGATLHDHTGATMTADSLIPDDRPRQVRPTQHFLLKLPKSGLTTVTCTEEPGKCVYLRTRLVMSRYSSFRTPRVVTKVLRVALPQEALPRWFAGDRYFDPHLHTLAEWRKTGALYKQSFGGPLLMVREAAFAMGFLEDPAAPQNRLITTDHSFYLHDDEFSPYGALCLHSPDRCGQWGVTASSPEEEYDAYRALFGPTGSQEAYIDANDSIFLAQHCLIYRLDSVIEGWHSGKAGPVGQAFPPITEALLRLRNDDDAFSFAAHPFPSDWSPKRLRQALSINPNYSFLLRNQDTYVFNGMQWWNERIARIRDIKEHSVLRNLNPFCVGDDAPGGIPCTRSQWVDNSEKLSEERDERFSHWLDFVVGKVRTSDGRWHVRKAYGLAASDAHGDFNYAVANWSHIHWEDLRVADTAFFRVRTYAFLEPEADASYAYRRTDGLDDPYFEGEGEVTAPLERMRQGGALMTDGPLPLMYLDAQTRFDSEALTWDDKRDELTDPADPHFNIDGRIGGYGPLDGGGTALVPINRHRCEGRRLRSYALYGWENTEEFGGTPDSLVMWGWRPDDGETWATVSLPIGKRKEFVLAPYLHALDTGDAWKLKDDTALAPYSSKPRAVLLRAELEDGHLGVTNPIWVLPTYLTAAVNVSNDEDDCPVGTPCIPAGEATLYFSFDVSMSPDSSEDIGIELRQLDGQGRASAESPALVAGAGWTYSWKPIGSLKDSLLKVVNDSAIPVSSGDEYYPCTLGPAPPDEAEAVTFVVFAKRFRDGAGNALNPIAEVISRRIPGTGTDPGGGGGNPSGGTDPDPGGSGSKPPGTCNFFGSTYHMGTKGWNCGLRLGEEYRGYCQGTTTCTGGGAFGTVTSAVVTQATASYGFSNVCTVKVDFNGRCWTCGQPYIDWITNQTSGTTPPALQTTTWPVSCNSCESGEATYAVEELEQAGFSSGSGTDTTWYFKALFTFSHCGYP